MYYPKRILASALAVIMLALVAAPEAPAQPRRCRGGIFSLYGNSQVPAEAPELASPDVAGISVRLHWKVMEPRPGAYDWSLIDLALDLARRHRKKVMIRVTAGMYSPDWVYQRGAQMVTPTAALREKVMRRRPALRAQLDQVKAPVPWDTVYLQHWLAFVRAMGARYQNHPLIYSVQMTGGGLTGEMVLRPELEWHRYGYSDAGLIAAWKQIIDTYQQAFPRHPTNLDIMEPIRGISKVLDPVVAYCLERYPGKVYLQQNGLSASGLEPRLQNIIRRAAARTIVGYQMLGGRDWQDHKVGDRGRAFDIALADGVSYVEVYRSDLMDPTLRAAVHRLAVGLGCAP
ncbi:MAG: hypothetical protein FJ128_00190 [Deltaproteobacteria bacterium]|nr:hypothetical protein [Deltaproteobacteria bacterium]